MCRAGRHRRNLAEDYHGCLVIVVRQSRETYWRIEALLEAISGPEAICGPEDVGEADAR